MLAFQGPAIGLGLPVGVKKIPARVRAFTRKRTTLNAVMVHPQIERSGDNAPRAFGGQ